MTEVYIDGILAVLGADFSATVKHENSFLTKNGEYTYDVQLPLDNAVNAQLYGFLNRLNKKEIIKTGRSARFIANNRLYCNGTEIITDWDNDSVKIQITSGNSELNYFINSTKLISTLNLGSANVPSSASLTGDFLSKIYPETEFILSPLIINGETKVNMWNRRERTGKLEPLADGKYIAQPYLCAIVRKIITSLGYTINKDELSESRWKYIVICHGVDTTEYAKMLPGWTVADFMGQVEKLLNICFIVNQRDKTVDIMFEASFYSSQTMVHLANVTDDYDVEQTDDEEESHTTANIGYKLPSENYWYRRRLPAEIKKITTEVKCPNYSSVVYYNVNNTPTGKEILINSTNGYKYIINSAGDAEKSDQWCDLIRNADKESLDIELEFIPVMLGDRDTYTFYYAHLNGEDYPQQYYYLPARITTSEYTTPQEYNTLNEYLDNGSYGDSSESKSTVYLGFYTGTKSTFNSLQYPLIYNDTVAECREQFIMNQYNTAINGESFRLSVIGAELYGGEYAIDKNKNYEFQCWDPNVYDVRKIFEIRNKRYVCEYIEYKLDRNGRNSNFKGVFHPISISDTEAERRWILTDGKWRDGGVFIDSGRWLEN